MKQYLLLFALVVPFITFAQLNTVTGTVIENNTGSPAAKATVYLTTADSTKTQTTSHTSDEGSFSADVPTGEYILTVQIGDSLINLGNFKIEERLVSLGTLSYTTAQPSVEDYRADQSEIPTISLTEDDMKDAGTDNVSSALGASRDPYQNAAAFIFSEARFRIRGYRSQYTASYMNASPVNDIEDGMTAFGQWGGLNNVMQNRETSIGLAPTTYTFGGIGGAYTIDTRASKQRKQLQLSYATTNRNYRHRIMATYSSGLLKHGWAVSASFSRRWAGEGYVAGTFYDGYSYFLSVEKLFGNNHSVSLTAIGAPVRAGGSSAVVQELYNLAGSHYYNPDWGYQNGKKRNESVRTTHQPLFLLNHDWKINNKSSLVTAFGFSFGTIARTAFDWNNAPDPHPDYYRYLPSYQTDSTQVALAEKAWREDPTISQVDWDKLYQANYSSFETVDSVEGIPGNTVSGKRARYILESRVENQKKYNLSSTYNNNVNDHISVTAGITYQGQVTGYYKKVEDLLGAEFYVDINQFALRDFPDTPRMAQNDLNHPNRILKEGDVFGYNYVANVHRAGMWGQGVFKYKHIDFFAALELSYTGMWREGKTRVGLFPNNSYGNSDVLNFFNYAAKAGVTYKVNGRNYVFLNGEFASRAPYFDEVFMSPRTRNSYIARLNNETVYGGELGYNYRAPKIKVKLVAYYTQFNNQTETTRYYHGDIRSMVNYTLTGIDTRHWGFEIGAEAKIYKGFSATLASNIGRYQYTSRPEATITQDNSPLSIYNETVYAKGYNVGGSPQFAGTIGINYRDPKFWFINVNFNYYDWMWTGYSPARRTEGAVDAVDPNGPLYNEIVSQERLKGQFIMDIFAGYSWMLNNQFKELKHRQFLVFNIGISNVTNNRSLVTNAYEQTRFDFVNKNPKAFPSKYSYAYGTTYFVSIAYRFQQ